MECVNLFLIPREVLEHILETSFLSCSDVCKFGSTCSEFWQFINTNHKIWKVKFKQRWPQLVKHEVLEAHQIIDWPEACKLRCSIGRETMALVNNMVAPLMTQQELSACDFLCFEKLYTNASHPRFALQFMIDELMNCANEQDRDTNLTNKYYCEKVLRHLRQIYLAEKWEKYKNLPPEEQLLERGAVIVAQWSQPLIEITDKTIAVQLDAIAAEVRNQLCKDFGKEHAAMCVPADLRAQWQTRNLEDNHYSAYVSRQVTQAVSTVLFNQFGFHGNSDMYYCHENSFINKVLEHRRGIPITLSILFESITRRLGIKCEPVSFPGHFLLRWRDTYKKDVQCQHYYIDVFNGGTFLGKDSCPQFPTPSQGRCPMGDIFRFGPASAIKVVERMVNNLEVAGRQRSEMNGRTARLRSALELLYLVNPLNVEGIMHLTRFYKLHLLDLRPLYAEFQRNAQLNMFNPRDTAQVSHLMEVMHSYCKSFVSQNEESAVKRRGEGKDVAFSVGMVMHHLRHDYTCVIIGWDSRCQANREWMEQMEIVTLQRKHLQPFYSVLVNDGTNRYAAEENLEPLFSSSDCWVTHTDVGRYFDTFCGTHYQPNHELLRLYPDDPPVLRQWLGPQ